MDDKPYSFNLGASNNEKIILIVCILWIIETSGALGFDDLKNNHLKNMKVKNANNEDTWEKNFITMKYARAESSLKDFVKMERKNWGDLKGSQDE